MRKAHYWKPAGAASAPANVLVFDCETWFGPDAAYKDGEIQRLRFGVALAYRLEKGKRTRSKQIVFYTAEQFWSFVRERLDKRRPLWVFAHNVAYDLGCVNGWKFITNKDYAVKKAAVSGQLFFLKGRLGDCALHFCDTGNYYRSSLKTVGKGVGLPKLDMPAVDAPDSDWVDYCKNDVAVTAMALDKLLDFIRSNKLGPFQPSIAGLSFSAYRSSFMDHNVLVHAYKPVLEMERRSYYGGIVDVPLVGRRVAGPIYELDVCSMYPSVCQNPLPYRFESWNVNPTLADLDRMRRSYLLVADVILNAKGNVYPTRLKRGTYFPTGRFFTTLAHPELCAALDAGDVHRCLRVAWYRPAPIFSDYMRWFTDRKQQYDREGNDAFRTLCKMYNTNLYGKCGQMTPKWSEWGKDSLKKLEEDYRLLDGALSKWYDKPPTLYNSEEPFVFTEIPLTVQCRDLYGVVEVKVGEYESRESCPAIAATVTSYARCLLRSYQRTAGSGNWFYSDTDSIWVNQEGRDRLEAAGSIRPGVLGYLDEKAVHEWLLVHGPKDYETPTVLKRKGIRKDAELQADGGWKQLQFPSAMVQIRDGIGDGVYVRHTIKHLRRVITKSMLLPSGHTRPLVFPIENPERIVGG